MEELRGERATALRRLLATMDKHDGDYVRGTARNGLDGGQPDHVPPPEDAQRHFNFHERARKA